MGLLSSTSNTDACAFLDEQHNEVDDLFATFEDSDAGDSGGRQIFEQIRDKLRAHAQIEEEIFYPPIKNAKAEATGEEIAEAVEEHYQIKLIIADIDQTRPRGDVFKGKMKVLKEDVEHHVGEERDTVFPDARKYLGKERLEEVGNQLRARAEELMKRGARTAAKPARPRPRATSSRTRRTAARSKSASASKSPARGKSRTKARR